MSTASTRPLYGRGAGSTPAGGSRTLVAQWTRAPPCEGGGRWFESSRVYVRGRSSDGKAPGRQPGEARSTRVVRSHEGPWCNGKHGELQPRWSGFDSWGACCSSRRGPERLGYLVRACASVPLRFDTAPDRTPRPRRHSCCGPEGSGYRLRIDRSRVRVPPGALACSGSSVGRAVPGQPHDCSTSVRTPNGVHTPRKDP